MKLIQLNIWQGRIIRHVVRFLQDEQPDIVCMQEVMSTEKPVNSWDCFSSYETIQAALPDIKYWFFAPLFSYTMRGSKVTQGNVIGSRFPIDNQQVTFTNGHYVDETDPVPNTRNFQTCQINLGDGKQFSLVNHHAYWDKNPMGTPESVQRMKLVKDTATQLPRPLILTGDLNTLPNSETMRVFSGVLENLIETHNVKTTLSPVGAAIDADNMVACDHVLVSSEINVRQFAVSDEIVSDHKALILEFDI